MAIHKNYLPSFPESQEEIIKNIVLPNQDKIFYLFAKKITQDANEDEKKERFFLAKTGKLIAEHCQNLHNLLSSEENKKQENINLTQLVKEIIDMDYQSVVKIFQLLLSFSNHLWKNDAKIHLEAIIAGFEALRSKSKRHTTVISK